MSDTPAPAPIPNGCAATPHDELIAQIIDSRVAKSEREWAAKREIEWLRENAALDWRFLTVKNCRDALEQIAGALRRINRWSDVKRVQKAADALYPKDEIRPQPIIPRSNHG